jgi:hypothetical protein
VKRFPEPFDASVRGEAVIEAHPGDVSVVCGHDEQNVMDISEVLAFWVPES